MPTRRMIDPAFWQSQHVAEITDAQRLLFIGLISNADDQGRLEAHPGLIRSAVYPREERSFDEIEANLAALVPWGILFYEHDGSRYIQIVKWWEYQKPQWAYPSKFPAPEGWQDRMRYREGGRVLTVNWPGTENGQADESLGSALGKDLPKGDSQGDTQAHSSSFRNSIRTSDSLEQEPPTAATGEPPPSKPPPRPNKLTQGQRLFLDAFGAKRFKTRIQREAVFELEREHGTTKLSQYVKWAATKGMRLGDAVVAAKKALPRWGEDKDGTRRQTSVPVAKGLGERA